MIEKNITPNENLVQVFCGVRGYEEDGVAYLHIEDSARGLGFERTESKNGIEYNSIRWERVEGFLAEFGFRPRVGENAKPHDYYIPENIFYRLCMKAKNDVAEAFQAKVADEIIPSIRKTGSYSVNQTQQQSMMCLPHDYESALEALLTEVRKNKALQAELASEKEAHEKDNNDFKTGFDIINAQKAQIGSTREATAMATASSARARQRFAEKVLEINAGELITLRAVVEERRSQLWDANQTAHEISKLRVLKREYSLSTLENKARELLSHFALKLNKDPIPFPNGSTYTDSFGRLQASMSTYYEKDVVDAVLDWVVKNTNKFARVGGKQDPLRDEW